MVDKIKFENSLEEMPRSLHKKQAGRINALLKPEFVCCDADEMSVSYKFPADEWAMNRGGTLHGGIMASMFDLSFGALTRAVVDLDFVPTVELSTTYLRPVMENECLIIEARVLKTGKKITHVFGEAYIEQSGKKAAFGKGIFYNENTMA